MTLGATTTVAPMAGHRFLSAGEDRLRIGSWRGDVSTAHLTPGRGRPTPAAIARALDEMSAGPYRAALTAALPVPDQRPFLEAGFEVHERLHLLVRDLADLPPAAPAAAELRRGHQADRPAVLIVDAAAFPPFWRLDRAGLDDAIAATPTARLRVSVDRSDRSVTGYAVTGRAGPRGYLQRLAVAPGAQGAGVGTALVVDGLRWLRRWGAKEVLVNTQEGNEAAVRLYERLGFRLRADGLAVLRRTLGRAS